DAQNVITVDIDATGAPRNIIRIRETMPVTPGSFLIRYPKWRPGNHGPTGPLANIVEFHVSANGKELKWKRDGAEMYDIHVDVPAGVSQIQIDFVNAQQPGRSMTSSFARVKTIEDAFLPQGNVEQMSVKASVTVPPG